MPAIGGRVEWGEVALIVLAGWRVQTALSRRRRPSLVSYTLKRQRSSTENADSSMLECRRDVGEDEEGKYVQAQGECTTSACVLMW